jgi:hypothetical protein
MSVLQSFGQNANLNQGHVLNAADNHVWVGGYMSFLQSPTIPEPVVDTDAATLTTFNTLLENYATKAGDNDFSTMNILFDRAPILDNPSEQYLTPNELVTKRYLDTLASSYAGVLLNTTNLFTQTNTFTDDIQKQGESTVTTGNIGSISGDQPDATLFCRNKFSIPADTVEVGGTMTLGSGARIKNLQGVLWAPGTRGNFNALTASNFPANSASTYVTPLFTALPWTSTFFITNSIAATGWTFRFNGNGFDGQSVVLINGCQTNTNINVVSSVSSTRFVTAAGVESTSFSMLVGCAYQLYQTTLDPGVAPRVIWTIVAVDSA